tara:strand:- start:2843 stop:3022 length:180 start_codon:yes stop_codon:yes gene_type:complete
MLSEKEYKFTIKKQEHLRGKPYIEYKDNRVNRGLTLNEIKDLYSATFDILVQENILEEI